MGERIVVGLGNPGPTYARTRHNVGFMVVEWLAQRWAISLAPAIEGLAVGHGMVAGAPVRLVQPREYMNCSGPTVRKLPGAWHVEDVVVVYDDIDLPPGRLRVRPSGGAGGHRGLESMVATFGSGFTRVRVGVGRPPLGQQSADFVLQPLHDDALLALRPAIERASDAIECLLTEGVQQAMNRFNVRSSDETADSTLDTARRTSCGDTRH